MQTKFGRLPRKGATERVRCAAIYTKTLFKPYKNAVIPAHKAQRRIVDSLQESWVPNNSEFYYNYTNNRPWMRRIKRRRTRAGGYQIRDKKASYNRTREERRELKPLQINQWPENAPEPSPAPICSPPCTRDSKPRDTPAYDAWAQDPSQRAYHRAHTPRPRRGRGPAPRP